MCGKEQSIIFSVLGRVGSLKINRQQRLSPLGQISTSTNLTSKSSILLVMTDSFTVKVNNNLLSQLLKYKLS